MKPESLRAIPLFEGLDAAELAAVAALVGERRCERNAVIFHEGDPVETIFFIVSGLVKVFTLTDDGREQTINLLRPGEFFPHVGFLEGGRTPATAVALEESRLAAIRRTELLDLVARDGRIAVAMLKAMGRRITALQRRVKDLAHRDLPARVALTLLRLAEEHGTPRPTGATALGLHLTHQELANLIGAARESVSRALGDLRREGALFVDPQGHMVIDRRRLLQVSTRE